MKEEPHAALVEIAELCKSQDWTGLVLKRCVDTEYAVSSEDLRGLIVETSKRFSSNDSLAEILQSFESALQSEPAIDWENGTATFASHSGDIVLSMMDTGEWGMRL